MNNHKGWETKLRTFKFKEKEWSHAKTYFTTFEKQVQPHIVISLDFTYPTKERLSAECTETSLSITINETCHADLKIINWRKFQQFIDAFNTLIPAR